MPKDVGFGLDMARDFQSTYLDQAGDGPAMVMDGRAAALWGGGSGWPGFTAVARGPQGARFIAPTAEERARIQAKHAFLKTLTIPAGAYPGQSEPVVSVGSWSFILARPDLPEETAYRLARALHKGESALGARLPQARETTAANTIAAAPRPDLIHPGARRYFREAGLSSWRRGDRHGDRGRSLQRHRHEAHAGDAPLHVRGGGGRRAEA